MWKCYGHLYLVGCYSNFHFASIKPPPFIAKPWTYIIPKSMVVINPDMVTLTLLSGLAHNVEILEPLMYTQSIPFDEQINIIP